jgi:hypothetical protein
MASSTGAPNPYPERQRGDAGSTDSVLPPSAPQNRPHIEQPQRRSRDGLAAVAPAEEFGHLHRTARAKVRARSCQLDGGIDDPFVLATGTLDNVKSSQEIFNDVDISVHSKAVKELQRKEKAYSSMGRKQQTIQFEEKDEIPEEDMREERMAEYVEEQPEKEVPVEEKPFDAENRRDSTETPEEEPEEKYAENEDKEEPLDSSAEEDKDKKRKSGSFFDEFD